MITIGDKQLSATKPTGLDALLVRTTGCSAAEHARMIQQRPLPFAIARALAPMIEPATSVADLATLIEELDAGEAIALAKQVAVLLTTPPPAAGAPVLSADMANG